MDLGYPNPDLSSSFEPILLFFSYAYGGYFGNIRMVSQVSKLGRIDLTNRKTRLARFKEDWSGQGLVGAG